MKQLEDENSQLRRLVAQQALDIQGLKAVVDAKKREAIGVMLEVGLSERRAARLVSLSRTGARYTPKPEKRPDEIKHLVELAHKHRRFGYRRLGLFLRRDGFRINDKRVQRLCRLLSLQIRKKRKRRRRGTGEKVAKAMKPNSVWAMDFMSDSLSEVTPSVVPFILRVLTSSFYCQGQRTTTLFGELLLLPMVEI
ncbi:MAG: transposase [Candidatus Melainabacteria bacterium]|nr:transposase [Candidatus Melainabacteria bacterium]